MQKPRNQPIGPGVQKVVDYITGGIDSGALRPGTILPGRKELARIISVSPDTVTVATGVLKKQGILAGVKGQRCRIPGRLSETSADHPRRMAVPVRAWDAVAVQIRDDITGGAFASGASIPTCKELRIRYQTSYVTLRKALESLTSADLLSRRGCRYMVPSAALPAVRSHVLFVWFSIPTSLNLPPQELDTSFICLLERECLRNGVALKKLIVSIDSEGEPLLRQPEEMQPADPRMVTECAGIVYLVSWFAAVNQTVFSWLAHTGKPVSIVDWLGGWDLPKSLSGKSHLQVVSSRVTRNPGLDAGRFLIGRGHRRIAYFSPRALTWPVTHLQGITDAYAAAGPQHSVTPFCQRQVPDESEFQTLVAQKFLSFQPSITPLPDFPDQYLAGREHVRATAWIEYENAVYFDTLVPLFEHALTDNAITAWVGCDDAVAIMAWSFLRAKRIAIPGTISLVGFGNTTQAFKADITSYDFNFESSVRSVLMFLLRPNLASRVRKLSRPQIEGYIIERGSTAQRPRCTR